MSDTEFFNRMVAAGEAGEDIIMEQLPIACRCWRGISKVGRGCKVPLVFEICCQPPTLIDHRKNKAFQEVLDIDAQLHFSCGGCPVFDALGWGHGDAEIDQWHEIKTNYETHGQSASGSGKEYTQNIAIETVENKYWKKNHTGKNYQMELEIKTDPRNGDAVCVRHGAGWFNKTTDRNNNRVLADWFHFYQPIDAENFANWNVERATQEEIDRWLNDDAVPAGSTLITQYPFSYCISIRGSYLEKIVYETIYDEEWEEELIKERYGKAIDIGAKQKGYLVPIADILPCLVYRRGYNDTIRACLEKAEGTGKLFSQDDIIAFIAGDSIIQKPFSAASRQDKAPMRYIIKRIYEFYNVVYEPQRVTINIDGKERTIAEGAGIEAIIVKPQQEKHRAKQEITTQTKWRDEYSDLYLMPEPLEMMAAAAEKY